MLRECIRHEPLAKITLGSEQFYDFFRYVEMSTFDIASDAFATFKVRGPFPPLRDVMIPQLSSWHGSLFSLLYFQSVTEIILTCACHVFQDLLTRHKLLSAEFLEQHYDKVGAHRSKAWSTVTCLESQLSIITDNAKIPSRCCWLCCVSELPFDLVEVIDKSLSWLICILADVRSSSTSENDYRMFWIVLLMHFAVLWSTSCMKFGTQFERWKLKVTVRLRSFLLLERQHPKLCSVGELLSVVLL